MLWQQACALVLEPCRTNDIPPQVPLFTGLKLVYAASTNVVIIPAEEDPLVIDGDFPLPELVRRRLNAMERAGVPFETCYTYIVHEVLPYSIPETGPLPHEAIAPRIHTAEVSARLGHIADALTTTLVGGLKTATHAGLRGAAFTSLGLGGAAAYLLDPLIFGAIADERGMATWFVFAQWAW